MDTIIKKKKKLQNSVHSHGCRTSVPLQENYFVLPLEEATSIII